MKFFIFTCLLAVALAKHEMEHSSSSEESVNISQEKFQQEKNVVIYPNKEITKKIMEVEHSRSSSSEEFADIPTENKINPFYQKLNFLQYLQALQKPQIVINPWDQIKTSAYLSIPTVIQNREHLSTSEELASFSQKETPKTTDMKTKLTKEKKNHLKHLNKIAQYYQQFPMPQYFKTAHQYQTTMKPWDRINTKAYQIIPTLRYF